MARTSYSIPFPPRRMPTYQFRGLDGAKVVEDKENVLLIRLRDELYEGSWLNFARDINKRRKRKPHMPYMVRRIESDMLRIRALQKYERENSVNLNTLLPEE